jgi:hypothetical protein
MGTIVTSLEALRTLAPFARPHGFELDAVRERLSAEKSSADLVRALGEAMLAGELTASAWRDATSSSAPLDFIPALGSLWNHLVSSGVASSMDGFPETWTQETLRLWGYVDGWLITSEDEDCALMTDEFVPGLLELASDRACPKREYALGLVRQWARNRARGAARSEKFREVVAGIGEYAPLARRANDMDLASYFLRLASYAAVAPVDRTAAYQRALDLAPQHEPRPDDVKIEEEALCFRLEIFAAKALRVRKSDGRLF